MRKPVSCGRVSGFFGRRRMFFVVVGPDWEDGGGVEGCQLRFGELVFFGCPRGERGMFVASKMGRSQSAMGGGGVAREG